MSGQAGSIGSIALGAILIVAGSFGAPALILPGVLMLIGGAVGLAFAPKAADPLTATTQDLKIATAATGMPLPVVFGIARVTPNYIRSDINLFKAVTSDLPLPSQGGKGGGKPQGAKQIDYYHVWEVGLCMGEIDAVGQIFSMPGEQRMVD